MAPIQIIYDIIGFALQLVPSAILLFLPFEQVSYRRERRLALIIVIAVAMGFSVGFSLFHTRLFAYGYEPSFNLYANLYLSIAVVVIVIIHVALINVPAMHRFLVIFLVVLFAVVQFTTVNSLLDILPFPDTDTIYSRMTILSLVITTPVLLLPTSFFFRHSLRKYLGTMRAKYTRREVIFISAIGLFWFLLNSMFTAFWSQFQEAFNLPHYYYMLMLLLLITMLLLSIYSTIGLSTLRAAEVDSELEKSISRENYQRIRKDMDKQRKQLHDTKQLLRTVSMLAETGTKEELLSFIAQTSERLSVSDDRLCADTFLDSILRYYAASAREHNIPFSVEVRCDDLPFQETDITILLGNILENAIRSSEEWRNDHEGNRGIICKINVMQNLLGIYIENPCSMVKYAFRPESTCLPDGYLPAGAFQSTTGGGQGLMRIDSIARKYEGSAAFLFDDEAQTYYTRVILMMPE